MGGPKMLAADHVRELTRPFITTAVITLEAEGQKVLHQVRHPSLLDQIRHTVTGSTMGGRVFRPAYGSKPAGRLDALAFLERVNKQSKRLASELHVQVDAPSIEYRLQAISGALGPVVHDRVRAWWAAARVLTQHDEPPFAPNIPCPEASCEARGTIRVRLDPKVATCVECGSTWTDDDGGFARLAAWSEWASEHLSGAAHWLPPGEGGYAGELLYRVKCGDCLGVRADMQARELARARRRERMTA